MKRIALGVRCFLLIGMMLSSSAVFAGTLDTSKFAWMVQFAASGYDGASTLTNFPVLVRISEAVGGFHYADIGTTTNAAYAALRFADAAGDSLDYEIETWDPDGTSFIWVSLPTLSGTDTKFAAYYSPFGGYTLPAVHSTNVWTSAGYVGVWHLSDIVKNYANAYKAYSDQPWGHVFPDSTGLGAHATKGSTSWDTSLFNVPANDSNYHFPEEFGRANGTLGANGYTPFIIPPPAEGGGTASWTFSETGYSVEAWVFPFAKSCATFVAGQSSGENSSNFVYFASEGCRLCVNDWGGSTAWWNSARTAETGIWHYVSAVWTPVLSSDNSIMYGTSADNAPTILVSRNAHAADQFATQGMKFVGGSGVEFGLDEMRVRRELSTPDWVQANWDTQRVGTDFLSVGSVHDPSDLISHGATRISVAPDWTTVSLHDEFDIDASFAGTISVKYVLKHGGGTTTNAAGMVSAASPSVDIALDGLLPGTDYEAFFTFDLEGATHDSLHVFFKTLALDAPTVSGLTEMGATAASSFRLEGDAYAGCTAQAVFTDFVDKTTTKVAVAGLSSFLASTSALAADRDYAVKFVVERAGVVVLETPPTEFATLGRATLNPEDFRHSMVLTTTGYDGSSTLVNFPVLVHLSEADIPGFSYEGVKPGGIRFAAQDGTLLAHEIDTWDPSGMSTIWVSLPELSGKDTAFTMYWRPFPGVGTPPSQPAYRVWKYAGYLGVWHMGATVQEYGGPQFPDSSGYGMTTTNSNPGSAMLVLTNAALSANGSAWYRQRNTEVGDAITDWNRFLVSKDKTGDWDFSKTGYTVETWARPQTYRSDDHGSMFCTSLQEGGSWNALNAFCVMNYRVGFECNWKPYYKDVWTGEKTKEWHYVAAVWAVKGSGQDSLIYEVTNQVAEVIHKKGEADVHACDFRGLNMGLTAYPPPRASGFSSYQIDELRVRRGMSSKEWIQANGDTQCVGTDFLTAGEVKTCSRAFTIFLR